MTSGPLGWLCIGIDAPCNSMSIAAANLLINAPLSPHNPWTSMAMPELLAALIERSLNSVAARSMLLSAVSDNCLPQGSFAVTCEFFLQPCSYA